MFKYTFQKIHTGIEVSETSVNVAQIEKEGRKWRLLYAKSVPLPDGTLKLSYKNNNIIESAQFISALNAALEGVKGKVTGAGLSIPNEIVKISIRKYDELPEAKSEIEKIIEWSTGRSLNFPGKNPKIDYEVIEQNAKNETWMMVTLCISEVIRKYELQLRALKIYPKIIRPSSINQFNFFSHFIEPKGVTAFLGLYENYFSFLVFENDTLKFFHGIKNGFSDLHFFQDVDMTMQHYLNDNPEKEIERLYVGSQAGFHKELEEVFRNLSDMDIVIIDEQRLIEGNLETNGGIEREELSHFASAIGAAQSMIQ